MKARIRKSSCCSSGCCCGAEDAENSAVQQNIPVISTEISFKDILGAWKVRWGIGRMSYTVAPGLYAVGSPDRTSPVLVSANYKLTFDSLRKELSALNCWLLILDTKGVNVWCAAGKGTFGTDELVSRISATGLSEVVSQKKLILPQLGAVGVSAHEVTKRTGFSVIYGPVRAKEIKKFVDSGFQATEEMRTVRFTAWDRLALTPIQLMQAAKSGLMVLGMLFLINLFAIRLFGLSDFIIGAGSVMMGTVITPLLLPFIPGRAFAWKGWLVGFIWTAVFVWFRGWLVSDNLLLGIGYLLVLPSLSAFLAMDFTGSSTYTSFSGVIKEMKLSLPFILASSVIGIVLVLIKSFMA
ncbi:CO dehydrogenase/acetyl-CoA synthase gamma subunit (corrinoid Fe-S protein)-like protein [Syntrophobotulus glycolicus DSM 8271]|uniref:CO dehydrogenase/acetyl-CoA synthase gamma subunit (Corrinoid Fe-S protein)-like protein n=1 Tax=Syntrophobotulus glycolicus (strain DSM 8271 / FlGlyR) TaxID=645991 RepID=F0SUS3_SYNGF|nr:mercury methylation corrinoid protein HgcA [Syntrophobotulus glycolicus]ADY56639.1 CO dehydrogenase/acetyl-CoA synthase gamma subunit (corrinoid Fe-S protein)-like protein [Syntrophobotulus glycolicus DSM 8271]